MNANITVKLWSWTLMKLTCDDLRYHIYIYSPLKRCLKRYVLASFINFCTSEFDHFFLFTWTFGLGLLVWLCRFRRECCFIQNNIHFFQGHPPKSKTQAFVQLPWQLDTKDLHRLVFCIQTTRKSSQVEKKLAMKFELTHINRKLVQATTSHRKLAVKRGASMNKLKTYDDLRYLWSGL